MKNFMIILLATASGWLASSLTIYFFFYESSSQLFADSCFGLIGSCSAAIAALATFKR